jgi:predicted DNA-binding protein with PD1-like motif
MMRHPGPVHPVRIESREESGPATTIRLRLAPGRSLHDALVEPLAGLGLVSAAVNLVGGRLDRLRYVLAYPRPGTPQVVLLGDLIDTRGPISLIAANATLGRNLKSQSFLHCHGVFAGSDGAAFGGHVFAEDTFVGDDAPVAILRGFDGFRVAMVPDDEIVAAPFQPVSREDA